MIRYFVLLLVFISFNLNAQIKSPSEFLGYDIGTQFTRHADVVNYFYYVANNSDLVTYGNYGKTNERRLLTYAIVSSKENLENIELIKTNNLKNAGIKEGAANPEIAIVWLSYNVHGNEASSTEAAMQTLYELIVDKKLWLENTVVIIDPCVNPDGRDRYVNWYNQVKASPYDTNQNATEHNEPWPGGRPNHYLFDLNRDWVWASQVETKQRLKLYNQWMPHIHVDFHEQGINEPYYFAPAAEPFHEVISDWQRKFQLQIGKNHAKYFDREGWLFFTRERFDLLYPSYGDTYPTFMGAIGMTYEQAGHGRAGLGIDNDEGTKLTLVDRVKHHTTTSLSTIEISSQNGKKLNEEFSQYFKNDQLKYKSYVLNGNIDHKKKLTNLLNLHDIKWGYSINNSISGFRYEIQKKGSIDAKNAIIVSTDQPKGKMVKTLFEPDTKLSSPLTYDITSWSLPYAYGLETVASTQLLESNESKKIITIHNEPSPKSVGYISHWTSIDDASFFADLLLHDVKVRFSEKELSFNNISYARGSLIITRSDNKNKLYFDELITNIANQHQRQLVIVNSSFSDNGTDFGSPDVKLIPKQRIALLKGKGVSSLSYGSLWHFFETELKYPVTSIDINNFSYYALDNFDVLILPETFYWDALNEDGIQLLKNWIKKGGKIIAMGESVGLFNDKKEFGISQNETVLISEKTQNNLEEKLLPYDQREINSLKNTITGSVYKVTIDTSHPMAFGYPKNYYSLKKGSESYQLIDQGYNVGYIDGDAMSVAGFSGEVAKNNLKNSLVFGEKRLGKGSIIYMVDDVLFRSFWENGKLFLANAIFFVNNNKFRL